MATTLPKSKVARLPKNTQELRKIMERHELTCQQIADHLGVHLVTAKNWHRGKPAPRKSILNHLLLILKQAA